MGYEILNDDLYQDSDKPKKHIRGKKNFSKLILMFLVIVFLVVAVIFIFFQVDNLFLNKDTNLIVKANYLQNNQEYRGDITIKGSSYEISTQTTNFKSTSNTLEVDGFDGIIIFDNSSFVLSGVGSSLFFDNSEINVNPNSTIFIRAAKPATLSLENGNLDFNLYNGNLNFKPLISENINFDFDYLELGLQDYNGEVSFSNELEISGNTKRLNFNSDGKDYNMNFSFS